MGNYKRFRPKIVNVGGVPRGNVVAFENGVSGAGPMRSRHEVNAGGKRAYLPLQYAADSNKIIQ